MNRAARNATCCEHAASDHDTHGCAVNLSTHSRTYERCHGLVTAPDAHQSDELREAVIGALIDMPVVLDYWTVPITPRDAHLLADALLPVVTAWREKAAEAQARARAAEELFVLASRLVSQDVEDMAVYEEIRALRDALAADDRTDAR